MKKFSILFLLTFITLFSNAQSVNIENNRKVLTKGYAEKEVIPDIVYLSVSLKEFYKDGNQKKKTTIETLEAQLYKAAIEAGVKKENITIQNIYSYNQQDKKKNNELLQSRQYRIKVTNLNGLNQMMDNIDPLGLQQTSIESYDFSKKREIEKELKTLAVKDARSNAEILAAAENQKIGEVLIINDNSNFNFNDFMPQPRFALAKSSLKESNESIDNEISLNIRSIKLTCYIDCVFSLQ